MSAGKDHIIPLETYVKVIISLLILTVLTVAVAKPVSGFDAGFMNAFIAMAIASIKAFLVASWFMHLRYDNKLYTAILIISIFFLILLLGMSSLDWSTRTIEHSIL